MAAKKEERAIISQGRGYWIEIDKEWGKVCDQLNSF
jgi:hypothetical protein